MPAFNPKDLAAWTGGRWSGTPAPVVGFSTDSRRIGPGQAFVALKTDRRDGHDFLAVAQAGGASGALVAQADPGVALAQLLVADPLTALQAVARAHRRLFTGKVVGITGSAGKTSTKELLAVLLGGETGRVLATEGNLNNQIGVALTLTRIDLAWHRYAVVEAGISAPGEMRPLAAMIEPDLVIITLVGPAHLADLGGLGGVAREKVLLAGAVRPGGICLFPRSCEAYPTFRALPPASRLVFDRVKEIDRRKLQPDRVQFAVAHEAKTTQVTLAAGTAAPFVASLRRVTEGMAQNAAMAMGAALRLGTKPEEIQERLRSWQPSPLRGEWKVSAGRRVYLDCYNANPASMADALAAFDAVAPASEPRLLVIGCMEELGRDSQRYHLDFGRSLALRKGDHAIVIGGYAGAVRQGALESGCSPGQIEITDSAATVAATLAAFQGWIFVKGSRRYELEKAFAGAGLAEASHA